MTQADFFTQLKTTGYQVAYNNFDDDDKVRSPIPPYIAYRRILDDNISSDEAVHGKIKTYQVELYTKLKDLVAEAKLETVLGSINSEYDTSEEYIETEKLYQVVYQIKLIERR